MAMKPLPPLDVLREAFVYNPETGEITGRKGKPIGQKGRDGYLRCYLRYEGRTLKLRSHRVAWALAYGEDPYPLEIDHANRVRTDNRLVNLRRVTAWENQQLRGNGWARRNGRRPSRRVRVTYPDERGTVVVDTLANARRLLGCTLTPAQVDRGYLVGRRGRLPSGWVPVVELSWVD